MFEDSHPYVRSIEDSLQSIFAQIPEGLVTDKMREEVGNITVELIEINQRLRNGYSYNEVQDQNMYVPENYGDISEQIYNSRYLPSARAYRDWWNTFIFELLGARVNTPEKTEEVLEKSGELKAPLESMKFDFLDFSEDLEKEWDEEESGTPVTPQQIREQFSNVLENVVERTSNGNIMIYTDPETYEQLLDELQAIAVVAPLDRAIRREAPAAAKKEFIITGKEYALIRKTFYESMDKYKEKFPPGLYSSVKNLFELKLSKRFSVDENFGEPSETTGELSYPLFKYIAPNMAFNKTYDVQDMTELLIEHLTDRPYTGLARYLMLDSIIIQFNTDKIRESVLNDQPSEHKTRDITSLILENLARHKYKWCWISTKGAHTVKIDLSKLSKKLRHTERPTEKEEFPTTDFVVGTGVGVAIMVIYILIRTYLL